MKRKQFSQEQIIGILKEAEAGAVVTELCRKHGVSSATCYAWKGQVRRSRGVGREAVTGAREREQQAQAVAGRSHARQRRSEGSAVKKMVAPAAKREAVAHLRELADLIAERGAPKMIVSDNGAELTSNAVLAWSGDAGTGWRYIAPGKPTQNGFVESFKRSHARRASQRDTVLHDQPRPLDPRPLGL